MRSFNQSGIPRWPSASILRYVLFGVAAVIFSFIRAVNNHFFAGDICIIKTGAASRYSLDIQRLMTAVAIIYAFCGLIAILGLIQNFLCGGPTDFYVFMLISLFFFSVYSPKYGRWKERMKHRYISAGRLR